MICDRRHPRFQPLWNSGHFGRHVINEEAENAGLRSHVKELGHRSRRKMRVRPDAVMRNLPGSRNENQSQNSVNHACARTYRHQQ